MFHLQSIYAPKEAVLTRYRYLSADYERKVFNVSACVWNEGADESIVAITSKDAVSDPVTSGSPSSSSTPGASASDPKSGLGGGAIAGIVVGAVAALVLAALLAFCILRKRRKWMAQGFKNSANTPETDEAVLKGPVFNSGTTSNATAPHSHSSPFSAADISVPAGSSTGEYARSGADTPARTATNEGGSVAGGSTVELDGHDTLVRPNTELDGREIHPAAENPGVYELPGTEMPNEHARELESEGTPSRAGSSPSNDSREGGNSPPGTYVSTLGTTWERDERGYERGNSELVSPTTPRHGNEPRAF